MLHFLSSQPFGGQAPLNLHVSCTKEAQLRTQHSRCLTRSAEKISTPDVPATQFLAQPGRLLASVVGWLKVSLIPSAFSKLNTSFPLLAQHGNHSDFRGFFHTTPSLHPAPQQGWQEASTANGPGLTQQQAEEASFLVARNKFPGSQDYQRNIFTVNALLWKLSQKHLRSWKW